MLIKDSIKLQIKIMQTELIQVPNSNQLVSFGTITNQKRTLKITFGVRIWLNCIFKADIYYN